LVHAEGVQDVRLPHALEIQIRQRMHREKLDVAALDARGGLAA